VAASPLDPRPVDELVVELAVSGYKLMETSPAVLTLERINPWPSVVFFATLSFFSAGAPVLPRHERIHVHIDDDGLGVVQLHQ
jgi:hypothetical protein